MRTFPLLDTNRSFQMFTHHLCATVLCVYILKWLRTLNTTVQVLEKIWMLNEVIEAIQMVFMNFWYIEHYGASFGDDIDA